MNEALELFKEVGAWLLAILVGVVSWFIRRELDRTVADQKALNARFEIMEKCAVTRDELQMLMSQAREDGNAKHQENSKVLTRIESKIDANEERSSKTRHDTNNTIHALELRFAEKLAVMDRNRRDDE